jgi:hypothetical protein
MTKLPTAESLGPMPTARTNRPIATVDLSAKYKGLVNLGRGISQLGGALGSTGGSENVPDDIKFNTERQFQEFKYNQQKGLDESIGNMDSSSASGLSTFAHDWADGYKIAADEFIHTVPEKLKPTYDKKLFSTEQSLFGRASTTARYQQKRLYSIEIDKMRDDTYYNNAYSGNDINEVVNDFSNLVNHNPYLSPSEKRDKILDGASRLERAHIEGRVKRGEDIAAIEQDLQWDKVNKDGGKSISARLFKPEVNDAISAAAKKYDLDADLMETFARIESGGNPNAKTGLYKGLFQLSTREFNKYGGGNIFDPKDNAMAAASLIKDKAARFQSKHGRAPTALDLYMTHQQGEDGYDHHLASPNELAWENVHATAEGQEKGEAWAKRAIRGNVPTDVRKKLGKGTDELTSAEFVDIWRKKVARFGGDVQIIGKGKYPHITVKQRNEIINRLGKIKTDHYEAVRADFRTKLKSDIESIRNTGTAAEDIDYIKAKKVLGDREFEKLKTKRNEASMEYQYTHDIPELTDEQIEKRLDQATPKAGATDYKLRNDVFQKVQRQVKEIRRMRRNDPAAAVDVLPDMKDVLSAYRENPDAPEAAQALVETRLELQEKIGIPPASQAPITRDEAKRTKGLDGQELLNVLKRMTGELEEKYGSYAPMVGTAILQQEVHDKETAQILQYQLQKAFEGQPMSAYEKQKLDVLNEAAASGKAFSDEAWALSGQMMGGIQAERPPHFKEGEMDEVLKLPPGTKFFDPNGVLRVR